MKRLRGPADDAASALLSAEVLMARAKRRSLSSPYFHVVNRSVRKTPLFRRKTDYRAFLTVLSDGLVRHGVKLLAYCVLSNHWHLVVETPSTAELSRFMQWVTSSHAVRWHRHHLSTGQGPVYQGRFRAEPIDAATVLVRTCRYVERNALRAGLVKRAQDWPWCSLAERARSERSVPLASAPFLTSTAWIEYVNAPLFAGELPGPSSTSGTKMPKPVENSSDPLNALNDAPLNDSAKRPRRLAGRAKLIEQGIN
jgi:putative transposase